MFEVIQQRADKIVWMFEQIASGVSVYAIASALNQQNYPTWGHFRKVTVGQRFWDAKAIMRIVAKKAVLGHFTSHTFEYDAEGEAIRVPVRTQENYFPAIVSPALWQRANDVLAGRRATGVGGGTGKGFANLFTKMVRCASCGSAVVRAGSTAYSTLTCSARRLRKCDSGGTMPYQTFDDEALDFITEVDLTDNRDEQRVAVEARIATLSFEIDQLNAASNNLLDLIDTVPMAKQRLVENAGKVRALDAEREAEQARLDGLRGSESPTDRKAALAQLRAQMDTDDEAERYRVRAALNVRMQQVIERIELATDGHAYLTLRNHPGTRYGFYRGVFMAIQRHQNFVVNDGPISWDKEFLDEVPITHDARGPVPKVVVQPRPTRGWKHSDETKRRQSEIKRAQRAANGHPCTGKKWSEEQKAKLSAIHKARFAKKREQAAATNAQT
ncbi:recombinase family protein [Methylobacterium iners]|uniref:Nuclease associated modular domain-containing protein n=1 Tax=Methylobacterium iners TaxID=418707 RepID=A0ABQ4RWM3_9HYPH|nr:recombinase family protein [Methylobacterium iners]GJD94780.1 hypothetical protein OCOJLMKI_1984 [Methylobacterium iners]